MRSTACRVWGVCRMLALAGVPRATPAQIELPPAPAPSGHDVHGLIGLVGVITQLAPRADLSVAGLYLTKAKLAAVLVDVPVRIAPFLTITPAYAYVQTPGGGHSSRESLFRMSATPRVELGPVGLDDRNLLEWRVRSPGENAYRYRNRLQAQVPFVAWRAAVRAFAYQEWFYESDLRAWPRTRYAVGLGHTFAPAVTTELQYIAQNNRAAPDVSGFGASVTVRLPR